MQAVTAVMYERHATIFPEARGTLGVKNARCPQSIIAQPLPAVKTVGASEQRCDAFQTATQSARKGPAADRKGMAIELNRDSQP
jgi:hypothetical protein